MTQEFQRENLIRLPLPLAQLYSRSHGDKSARGRHDNTYFLFEALIKLAAAAAVAVYVEGIHGGGPRVEAIDQALGKLALPSLGHWVAMLRELAHHFGAPCDAAGTPHPLGHLWDQLHHPHRGESALPALYRRIKNGVDGKPAGDKSGSPWQVIEALVQYRNNVLGHGASRHDAFYDEMAGLLFTAANEMLADGVLDILGPAGSRLVYITELRIIAEDRVEVGLRELVGLAGESMAPLVLAKAAADRLLPNRVATLWPGQAAPLRLDPLLFYRDGETGPDLLFLNGNSNRCEVDYLSYASGQPERDQTNVQTLAALLGLIGSQDVDDARMRELAEEIQRAMPPEERPTPVAATARRMGEYELLATIGRGNRGVVHLARQMSLDRLVALKVLSDDLVDDEVAMARFRREVRALSRCEHPNIVKVLSSGVMPDGRLYYAMEYVPGCDLEHVWRELAGGDCKGDASTLGSSTWTQAVHSASHRQLAESVHGTRGAAATSAPLAALPALPQAPLPELPSADADPGGYVRRVAMLIRDAALGMQVVHDQQIVHRDIKPANLMLTSDGARVVLMDFGLAKGRSLLAATVGDHGGFLGTLRYAAPEQLAAAKRDVGPAADVRGLGITLWELLTRKRLFDEAEDEMQLADLVADQDVPRLRSIDPSLDRDLEAIVARATERRVADRIPTAAKLAEYLQLYLDGQPLPIRPPTRAEQAWRWVRSNPAVASLLVALLVTLTGGLVGVTSEWRRSQANFRRASESNARLQVSLQYARDQHTEAESQRKRAEANFHDLHQAVDDYFTRVSESKLLDVPRLEPLRKQLLESALKYYQGFLRQKRHDPEFRTELARAYFRVASITGIIGSREAAIDAYLQSVTISGALARDYPGVNAYQDDLAASHNNLGSLYRDTGRTAKAEEAYKRALAIREALARDHPDINAYQNDMAMSHNNLGNLYSDTGRMAEAEAAYKHALNIREALVHDDPEVIAYQNDLALSYNNLGLLYSNTSRPEEAEAAHKHALDIRESLVHHHPEVIAYENDLALSYNNLGLLYSNTSRPEEAEAAYKHALAIREPLARDHPDVTAYQRNLAASHRGLGNLYSETGRTAAAEAEYLQALAIRKALARDHPNVTAYQSDLALSYNNVGLLYSDTGRIEEAEAAYTHALTIGAALARDHPEVTAYQNDLAACQINRANLSRDHDQPRSALEWYSRAVHQLETVLQREPRRSEVNRILRIAHWGRAQALTQLDRHAEALKDWDRAIALDDGQRREPLRCQRSLAFARLSNYARATEEATALTKAKSATPDTLYDSACVFALSSVAVGKDPALSRADRGSLAEDYAARAIELLLELRMAGFFKTKAALDMLKQDSNLDPLRLRDDFKKLLGAIEAVGSEGGRDTPTHR